MDALPALVTEHLGEVRALCEKYHVRKLTIFGSAVKGTFDPETSDLVSRRAVKSPYFLQVLELSEQPLYEAA